MVINMSSHLRYLVSYLCRLAPVSNSECLDFMPTSQREKVQSICTLQGNRKHGLQSCQSIPKQNAVCLNCWSHIRRDCSPVRKNQVGMLLQQNRLAIATASLCSIRLVTIFTVTHMYRIDSLYCISCRSTSRDTERF